MHLLISPGDRYCVQILNRYIRLIRVWNLYTQNLSAMKRVLYNKPIAASFVICNLIYVHPDIDTRGWRNNAASCLKVFLTIRR